MPMIEASLVVSQHVLGYVCVAAGCAAIVKVTRLVLAGGCPSASATRFASACCYVSDIGFATSLPANRAAPLHACIGFACHCASLDRLAAASHIWGCTFPIARRSSSGGGEN